MSPHNLLLSWMNKCCALPVQSYHTTSPSALDRNATRAPPAGLMWSLLGPITPRQRGCGWTCRTGGRALRPARWRTLSPMVQMWGRSKRLRWERVCGGGCAFRVSVRIVHSHASTHAHTHTHAVKYTHVAWSDCLSPCLQLGHDGATPESCWLVDELSVAVPTKGVKYVFACKCWLAKDRGDGLTSRVFNVLDAEAISISKKVCKCEQMQMQSTIIWQRTYNHIPSLSCCRKWNQLNNLH